MPPVNRRLRLLLLQFLVLVVLADAVGLGATRAFAASAEPHAQIVVDDVAAPGTTGGADQAPACSHSCHLVYHLVAPVSERPETAAALDAHLPPGYSPRPLPTLVQKAPFQPPRALA